MKVLIAGAGKSARELLRRLGQSWVVTLIDSDASHLERLKTFSQVGAMIQGDASSRVVLEEAGLAGHDYVLALTNRDPVNLEVCRIAKEAGVTNLASLVNDSALIPNFNELGVRSICGCLLVAREMELFLESPRLFVTTIAKGTGQVMELKVTKNSKAVGRKLKDFGAKDWLVAAIHREGRLVIPHGETVIQAGDSLTIVGRSELYRTIFHLFTVEEPDFPLEFGQDILLYLDKMRPDEFLSTAQEALYLASNTRGQGIHVLADETNAPQVDAIKDKLEESVDVSVEMSLGGLEERLVQMTHNHSIGCVVLSHRPLMPIQNFLGIPTVIALAHRLACPMLVSRKTYPYKHILVPYSMTRSSAMALELAIDLAKQLEAKVDVAVVEHPLSSGGNGTREWVDQAFSQARDIGKLHHFALGERRLRGNVVKELSEITSEYDLLVLGSTTRSISLLRPHVGEQLLKKGHCSTLVVT